MSKLAKKVIWWADVADAVKYAIRAVAAGVAFDYATAPVAEPVEGNVGAEQEFDLSTVAAALPKGEYDIYVTALDSAGNESDPFTLAAAAALNFTAPAAPAAGGFR
jgi:predicted phage tail protein